ncbi:Pyruvate:ferredoxin (Flavodoxin) oxidoreductase [Entamoeba marina]
MYSNTGGQKSKATNLGAVVKFAAGGNNRPKKDLGAIAMSYGDVYVASVALGANPAQAFKAFKEAESYNGVSIIVAYCPCKEQGVPLAKSIETQKMAVNSGYWSLYRYDPRLVASGKILFLGRKDKDTADKLHAQLKENIDKKLAKLKAASQN